nr:MAG TPA: hypothetical protein [Caudoviricetes sp.]
MLASAFCVIPIDIRLSLITTTTSFCQLSWHNYSMEKHGCQ